MLDEMFLHFTSKVLKVVVLTKLVGQSHHAVTLAFGLSADLGRHGAVLVVVNHEFLDYDYHLHETDLRALGMLVCFPRLRGPGHSRRLEERKATKQ